MFWRRTCCPRGPGCMVWGNIPLTLETRYVLRAPPIIAMSTVWVYITHISANCRRRAHVPTRTAPSHKMSASFAPPAVPEAFGTRLFLRASRREAPRAPRDAPQRCARGSACGAFHPFAARSAPPHEVVKCSFWPSTACQYTRLRVHLCGNPICTCLLSTLLVRGLRKAVGAGIEICEPKEAARRRLLTSIAKRVHGFVEFQMLGRYCLESPYSVPADPSLVAICRESPGERTRGAPTAGQLGAPGGALRGACLLADAPAVRPAAGSVGGAPSGGRRGAATCSIYIYLSFHLSVHISVRASIYPSMCYCTVRYGERYATVQYGTALPA